MRLVFLLVFAVLLSSAAVAEQKVYQVILSYDNETVSLEEIFAVPGIPGKISNEPGYSLEVISFDGKILFKTNFEISLERMFTHSAPPGTFDETGRQISIPNETTKVTIIKNAVIELLIPYFSNAKRIDIYNPQGGKILEIPVDRFAATCGDVICQDHESFGSCNVDCPSGSPDGYCDGVAEGRCDPDCSLDFDSDCQIAATEAGKTRGSPWTKKAFGALLVIGVLSAIVLTIRKIRSTSGD